MIVKEELENCRRRAETWNRLSEDAADLAAIHHSLCQLHSMYKYFSISQYCHNRAMNQIKLYSNYRKRDRYYTIIGAIFSTVSAIGMAYVIYKLSNK